MSIYKIFNIKYFIYLVCFLLLFLYINNFEVLSDLNIFLNTKVPLLFTTVYGVNFIIGVLSFLLLLHNKYTRIPILIIFTITSIIDLGYINLSNSIFGYTDALLILQEINSPLVGDAINSYINYFIKPFIIVSIISLTIYFIFRRENIKYTAIFGVLLYIISLLLNYKILHSSTGKLVSFTSITKIPSLFTYVSISKLYAGDRDEITIRIESKPKYKHIIYIIDESIRGDMLGINGFKQKTTPFLNSIGNKIYNYGEASSGAICSSYSNSILLTGIQLDNLDDKGGKISRKLPYLLDYAKYAGFKTSFFDMQNSKDKPNNYLQLKDLENINYSYFLVDDLNIKYKGFEQDFIGLEKLTEYIHNNIDTPTFSYFVKQGSHFSYLNKFPKDNVFFKPIMESDSDFWKWNGDVKEKILNTYYNSLRWQVDTFFKDLLSNLNGTNTLIIYTSDHAQNIMDSVDNRRTHCARGDAINEMAIVPLFLIDINGSKRYNFVAKNINHASHFNIFGTILNIMGYKKDEVNKLYGDTLFDDLSDNKRTYTSGDLFGRGKFYKNDVNN
jgi:glucan phosphoethanolaminetransferase (alkaline phosphatase superfamily)